MIKKPHRRHTEGTLLELKNVIEWAGWSEWAGMAAARMPLGCTEGVDWGLEGVDG